MTIFYHCFLDGFSKVVPPIPAKLTMKIGGKDCGLHFPIGVTTTSRGDIVVADTGNHLVKIFSPDGKLRLTVGTTVIKSKYVDLKYGLFRQSKVSFIKI